MGNVFCAGEVMYESWIADDEFWGDVLDDAGREFRRTGGIERNDDDSPEDASEESRDPDGGVCAPEN